MTIDSEQRRGIFERVRVKALLRGTPIDDDPEFFAYVELWISGECEMPELRSRYSKLVSRRAQETRSARGEGKTTFPETAGSGSSRLTAGSDESAARDSD